MDGIIKIIEQELKEILLTGISNDLAHDLLMEIEGEVMQFGKIETVCNGQFTQTDFEFTHVSLSTMEFTIERKN